jgi:hypothetical protein
MNAVRNPYRIKRPKRRDLMAKLPCQLCSEKGKFVSRLTVLVTSHYLWFSSELSVPIPTITKLVELGCETCGRSDARKVELGSFYCVGVFPFLGAYKWDPTTRYLCEEHAGRKCLALSLVTTLVGYLGFPGIFVAPFRVHMNVSALKKAGFKPGTYGTLSYLLGVVLPVLAISLLVYLIVGGAVGT